MLQPLVLDESEEVPDALLSQIDLDKIIHDHEEQELTQPNFNLVPPPNMKWTVDPIQELEFQDIQNVSTIIFLVYNCVSFLERIIGTDS